ncbi:GMP synthase (glutamine-hydrolysing) [Roseovarius nanhaiticus]|uniref:GMP synthase (Glutamine-hydrolysing) n=1 Tax=Roseovarius nanhaiticus TaxID=573024 RepID=A0A1N7G0X0_9RHOB|nr:GMP synthase (glutamine-hydrolysing) [Roseovarius nanhaiticus]SIS06260.1 GMP synthase (glutamine-hydrolysing) [Roseovarius nanhaiticus]
MTVPHPSLTPKEGAPTIGILLCGHAPEDIKADMGDYDGMFEALFEGHGLQFRSYAVVDEEFPASITDCDGWLITGSKHGAYEPHPWIPPLEQFIRDVYADGRPMVGICFGHQIIAQALGGTVEKYSKGWAVGRQEYMIDGQTLALNAWHQDQVTRIPDGATVIGRNEFCDNAALVYDNRIMTVQPHPEHTAEFVGRLAESRGRGLVPDPLLDEAIAQLDQPTQEQTIAGRMAAFLKRGA